MLDAASFGVPQTRRRLFLLCDREKTPDPITPPIQPLRAAREILDRPGTWKSRPLNSRGRALPTLERAARATTALGHGVPFLVVYYSSDGAGGWQSLDRPLRTLTTLDRFGLVTWDGDTPMLRMLQVPELKRAMGFGKAFRIERGYVEIAFVCLGTAYARQSWKRSCGPLCGMRSSSRQSGRNRRAIEVAAGSTLRPARDGSSCEPTPSQRGYCCSCVGWPGYQPMLVESSCWSFKT